MSSVRRILDAEDDYWKRLIARNTCSNCGQLIVGDNPDKVALMRDHFKECVA